MHLKKYIPELKDEHRKMYQDLHAICKESKDYKLDILPVHHLVILTPIDSSKNQDDVSFNHLEYCFLVLPNLLPFQTWKYGIGTILHAKAKMDECIREGKHPIEYLHKRFTNK